MNCLKRFLLSTTLLLSYQIILCQQPLSAGKNLFEIPSTVSEEAQGALNFFNDIVGKSGQKLIGKLPELDDLPAWTQHVQEIENSLKSLNDQVVEEFAPSIEPIKISNIPVLDIKPKNWQDNRKIVVYIHGGGFVRNTAESQKIGAVPFAHVSGLRIISIDYDTAPFAKYEAILDQIVNVFKGLKDLGYTMQDIAAYGDSAGGNLVAAATLKMRDDGIGMPAAIALWSPWLDLTGSGDTYKTLEAQDPVLSADALKKAGLAYAPTEAHKNPYVSPLFGNFANGFSPTLIQYGTKEMLMSDSTRFYQALKHANQKVKLDPYEGMWHVFQVFSWNFPEGKTALQETANFFNKHLNIL